MARKLLLSEVRSLVEEEQQRLQEGWLQVLGDIGFKVLMTSGGRKAAAQALRGMASVVIIPTKLNKTILDAVGAQQGGALRKMGETMTTIGGTAGGLLPLAKGLEGLAKFLETCNDDDAKALQAAAQAIGKGT